MDLHRKAFVPLSSPMTLGLWYTSKVVATTNDLNIKPKKELQALIKTLLLAYEYIE